MKRKLSYFVILLMVVSAGFLYVNFTESKNSISNQSLLKILYKCGEA